MNDNQDNTIESISIQEEIKNDSEQAQMELKFNEAKRQAGQIYSQRASLKQIESKDVSIKDFQGSIKFNNNYIGGGGGGGTSSGSFTYDKLTRERYLLTVETSVKYRNVKSFQSPEIERQLLEAEMIYDREKLIEAGKGAFTFFLMGNNNVGKTLVARHIVERNLIKVSSQTSDQQYVLYDMVPERVFKAYIKDRISFTNDGVFNDETEFKFENGEDISQFLNKLYSIEGINDIVQCVKLILPQSAYSVPSSLRQSKEAPDFLSSSRTDQSNISPFNWNKKYTIIDSHGLTSPNFKEKIELYFKVYGYHTIPIIVFNLAEGLDFDQQLYKRYAKYMNKNIKVFVVFTKFLMEKNQLFDEYELNNSIGFNNSYRTARGSQISHQAPLVEMVLNDFETNIKKYMKQISKVFANVEYFIYDFAEHDVLVNPAMQLRTLDSFAPDQSKEDFYIISTGAYKLKTRLREYYEDDVLINLRYHLQFEQFLNERKNEEIATLLIKQNYYQNNVLYIQVSTALDNLITQTRQKSLKALNELFTLGLALQIDQLAAEFIKKDRESEKKRYDRQSFRNEYQKELSECLENFICKEIKAIKERIQLDFYNKCCEHFECVCEIDKAHLGTTQYLKLKRSKVISKSIVTGTVSSLGTGAGTVGVIVGSSLTVAASAIMIGGLIPLMIFSIVLALRWKREDQAKLIKLRILKYIKGLDLEGEITDDILASLTKKKTKILVFYETKYLSVQEQVNDNIISNN